MIGLPVSFCDLKVLLYVHSKHGRNVLGDFTVDSTFPRLFNVVCFGACWESCMSDGMDHLRIELARGFIVALPHVQDGSLKCFTLFRSKEVFAEPCFAIVKIS